MVTKAVEVIGLSKKFNNLLALDNLNFEILEGEILGLLGPNGAGKTTTIRILSGILKPTYGEGFVYGHSIIREVNKVRSIIGLLSENKALYDRLTAWENVEFYGKLFGFDDSTLNIRIKEIFEFLDLLDQKDKLAGKLSMGTKQKVALARALVNQPKVLLLDEPTSNLDPEMNKKIKDYIRRLSKEFNTTILISSHRLDEIERLCSKIVILNKGKIVTIGDIKNLKNRLWRYHKYCMRLRDLTEEIKKIFHNIDGITDVKFSKNTITYNCANPNEVNPIIVKEVVSKDGEIISLDLIERSLEELYLSIIRGKYNEF
ncbi:MAG: ABC transporter ATP-binding protein [Candidatus Odinarchaeia archaeon]